MFCGLPVILDPPPTGDCQFVSACHQLQRIYPKQHDLSPLTCRHNAVQWLSSNKSRFLHYLSCKHESATVCCDECFEVYIKKMTISTTFGDHLTLLAMANVFKVQWIIMSSDTNRSCVISSTDVWNSSLPYGILGHDTHKLHYLSLEESSHMDQVIASVRGAQDFNINCTGLDHGVATNTDHEDRHKGISLQQTGDATPLQHIRYLCCCYSLIGLLQNLQ